MEILENIELILTFSRDRSFEEYERDTKTIYAVSRALEIVSEASRRLPEAMKGRDPDIEWAAIAAIGAR